MKKEILFRGLRKDGEGFVYGSLVVHNQLECSIIDYDSYEKESYNWNDVIAESVGQFTGLKDNNGIKIFEGDKLQCLHWEPSNYQVLFIEGAFCLGDLKTNEWIADVTHMEDSTGKHFEVIGNIHEPCKQY